MRHILAIKEEKDTQGLIMLKAKQEKAIQAFILDIKPLQREEATRAALKELAWSGHAVAVLLNTFRGSCGRVR